MGMQRASRLAFIFALGVMSAAVVMSAYAVYAWTGPTQNAPNGNVAAPINTSATPQTKTGVLSLTNGLIVGSNVLWANTSAVGVNTPSPANTLHVNGNVGANGYIGAGCEGACESSGGFGLLYSNGVLSLSHPNDSNWGSYLYSSSAYGTVSQNAYVWTRLNQDYYGVYTNGAVAGYSSNSSYWGADFRAAGSYGMYVQNGPGYYAQIANAGYGLDTNGVVRAAAFYYNSDQRLKDSVQPLDAGMETLLKLNPVSFTWNDKAEKMQVGKHDIGLIAQEVEQLVPEAVYTDGSSGYKLVDYPRLVPVLINAIKDQQKQIDELRAEINDLKRAQK